MKIVITGAAGFIGSHITRRLVKEGFDVTALLRKESSLKFLPKNIKIIYADIRDPSSLKEALYGFDLVIHNAAFASDWGRREDFYLTNVTGTRNILNAIKENKINRLILTSTVGVMGEEDCKNFKNEDSPYKPRLNYFLSRIFESDLNHYRLTKTIAEKEAILFSLENNINLTVIRPSWVYGPREFSSGPYIFCKALRAGLVFIPAGEKNRLSVIYVEDLAEAYLEAVKKNLAGTHIFIISNGQPVLANEYLGAFARELGRKHLFFMPEFLFTPFGLLFEVLYKIFGIKNSPLLTRSRVKLFYCNNLYDPSKARLKLGFEAKTSLGLGVKKTVRWWRENVALRAKARSTYRRNT